MEFFVFASIGILIFILVLPVITLFSFARRIRILEQQLYHVKRQLQRMESAVSVPDRHSTQPATSAEKDKSKDAEAQEANDAVFAEAATHTRKPDVQPDANITQVERAQNTRQTPKSKTRSVSFGKGLFDDFVANARKWLIGGNTMAQVGMVILFFGVSFFLKYVAQQGLLPIEFRLAAAALGGMAITTLGWRLRTRKTGYGLILQGGGAGIMYLTVFSAVNMYELLPGFTGLALMVTLVALTSLLALLQNARSLVVLASVGGFLAPVLISQGGSHVNLFIYYLVLDAGILAIAWFKAWRELNLVGFLFTFIIGGAWGYRYYQPDYFSTTEPFLVLFYLFYVVVPILFAQRQPPRLKGYVDGTLVFGVPVFAFALQNSLVADMEYGLAFSALAAALFYAGLASALWRSHKEQLRLLTESFLALSVAFGTVAIPLALDGNWTAAAWSMEGAALVWIGLRQQRKLARAAGVLMQIAAGMFFLDGPHRQIDDLLFLNSVFFGGALISMAGFFSAHGYHRYRESLVFVYESRLSRMLLGWSLAWWFLSGLLELNAYFDWKFETYAALLFVSLSCACISILSRRLDWTALRYPVLILLAYMLLAGIGSFSDGLTQHPFTGWGMLAWTIAYLTQYWIMKRDEANWSVSVRSAAHGLTYWILLFLLSWELAWRISQGLPTGNTWSYIAWVLLPIATVLLLPALTRRIPWPLGFHQTLYRQVVLPPVVAFIGLWVLFASFQPGNPAPLSYLPLLNPLELVQLLGLLTILIWIGPRQADIQLTGLWFAAAFVTLNGIIARSVHFLGGIPFDFDWLWRSALYQTTLSIVWTIAALSVTFVATRVHNRRAWITGVILLAMVIAKLFLVDLANIGTIPRIVSFLVVGLLILLIGYLSPLPPKDEPVEAQ